MDKTKAHELLKLRLGMTSDAMYERLDHLLEAVIKELDDEKGIEVDLENARVLEFVISYAAWRYEKKSESAGMPRFIQLDLRNLYLHNKKERPNV